VGSIASAVKWAATTILFSAFYYYIVWGVYKCWCLGEGFPRWSGLSTDGISNNNLEFSVTDMDSVPDTIDDDPDFRYTPRQITVYPEFTVYSVWVYVYGWGLLLFVCIYCLAGVNVSSSCWWMIGMLMLCMDELIHSQTEKPWLLVIIISLIGAVTSLLCNTFLDQEGKFSEAFGYLVDPFVRGGNGFALENFFIGIVYPAMAPLIFFTIRAFRNTGKDLSRVFELATPFMVVISACILFGMQNGEARRMLFAHKNSTQLLETHANFRAGSDHNNYLHVTSMLLAPFAAIGSVRMLVHSILTAYLTEFIASFILVLATRMAAVHDFDSLSLVTFLISAVCFVSVLITKRNN
jgi:hypothetical protein